jgi:TamB, inner membrane protein subunit of TAM complex/AsmA-like C-terminal region
MSDKEMRLYKKSLAALIVVIVLASSVHFLLRSGLFSAQLTRLAASKIRQISGGSLTLKKASLSLIPTVVVLDGIVVPAAEPGRPSMTVDQVRVSLSPSSLLTQITIIKKIRLIGPHIVLRLGDDPLLPFLRKDAKGQGSSGERSGKLSVVIREIEIQNGFVSLQDPSGDPMLTLDGVGATIVPNLLMQNFQAVMLAKKVAVDQNNFHQEFSSMSAQVDLKDESLEVRRLELTNTTSRYTVRGSLGKLSQPQLALSVDASFPLNAFNAFLPDRFPMAGQTRIVGEVVGKGSHPAIRGKLSVKDWKVASKPVGRVNSAFAYQGGTLSFSDMTADVADGRVSGKVRISLADRSAPGGYIPYELSLQMAKLDPSALLPVFGILDYSSHQRLEGDLELEGRLEAGRFNPADLSGRGRIDLTEGKGTIPLESDEIPPTGIQERLVRLLSDLQKASIRFEADHGNLRFINSTASTSHSSLSVDGQIGWEGPLALEMSLKSDDVAQLATLTPLHGIQGGMDASGMWTGSRKDPIFRGTVRAHDIRLKNHSFETAEAELFIHSREIRFDQAEFHQKQSRYKLRGSVVFEPSDTGPVTPRFDIAADIQNGVPRDVIAIFAIELPLTVTASGRLSVKGTPKDFQLSTQLEVGPGSIYGQDVDKGTVSLLVTHDRLVFKQAHAIRGDTAVTGTGSIVFHGGEFAFTAQTEHVRLEDFFPSDRKPPLFTGTASGQIRGDGSFHDPRLEAHLTVLNIAYEDQSLGPGKVDAKVEQHRVTVELRMDRGLTGRARIDLAPGHPYHVDLKLADLDLKPWFGSAVPNLTAVNLFTTSGTLSADGRIDPPDGVGLGTLYDSDGTIVLSDFRVDVSGYVVTNEGEIRLRLEKGNVLIESLRFKGTGTSLAASGDLMPFKSYNFFINGEADLDLFRIFTKEITYGKGVAYLALRVTEDWKDPKIRGGLTINDAMIKSASLNQTLSIKSVSFSFNERQVLLESLDAELGGGKFLASGRIDLVSFIPTSFGLNLEFVDNRIHPIEGLTAQFNASFFVQGDLKSSSVRGEVSILRARYDRRLDWQDLILKLLKSNKESARPLRLLPDTTLNVQITGKDNIWVRNNVAKLPLEIDLVLKGTINRPILLGRVESKSGSFQFRRNDFKVSSATLDFINPEKIRPIIDLRASTRVKTYDIDLSLVGPVDEFDLVLTSNPTLPDENDILCLLTFTTPCSEVKTGSKGLGTEASTLVSGGIQGLVTDEVETFTGIDRIQVDPYYSTSSPEGAPMLTVSKRLFEDKLYATYGVALDASEAQIIQMEYTISDRLSLVGTRDELGHVGGDLKLHFEFR